MIRDVALTDELKATLRDIDRIKADIASQPVPPGAVLQRLGQEFIAETIYHGMRLDAYMREVHGRD